MGNKRLRTAMTTARVDVDAVAVTAGVDPKTVQRWLAGRTPHTRHRWAVASMVGEDEHYLWPVSPESASYRDRFRRVWQTASDEPTAIRQAQGTFGAALPGQLINIEHHATITIEPDGSAAIEQSFRSANVSHEPLLTVAKDMWFEHDQPSIQCRGSCDRSIPMQLELVRDFPNYKQLSCNFVKPIKPLETWSFAYRYRAEQMFRSDHFWDQRVVMPTKTMSITIEHETNQTLASCVISKEFQAGHTPDPDPDIEIVRRDDAYVIRWAKEFPEAGGIYRLRWSFDD
jgi:hypothetical protein